MTPFSANPVVYIFSVVILVAVLGYFAYGAVDYMTVPEQSGTAVVTGKQYNPPGTTSRTNIVAGRAWTQTFPTSETYVLTLRLGNEQTVATVGKPLYDKAQVNDAVSVRYKRTRFSGRIEVTDVQR